MSSAAELSIENLNVILDELAPLKFSDIFSAENGDTIVFSAENTKITVSDSNGATYGDALFSYDADGNITGIAAVPEPSALAAVFGALAFGAAVFSRRR